MTETKTHGMQRVMAKKGNPFWCLEDMAKKGLITQEKLEKIKNGDIFYNEVLGLTTAKELNEAATCGAIRRFKDLSGATRWIATWEEQIAGGKKRMTFSRAYEGFMLRRQRKSGAEYYEGEARKSLAHTKENEEVAELLDEAKRLFQ